MEEKMLYKDASQPVEARVEDLLSRMTLEEKAAQLCGDLAASFIVAVSYTHLDVYKRQVLRRQKHLMEKKILLRSDFTIMHCLRLQKQIGGRIQLQILKKKTTGLILKQSQ